VALIIDDSTYCGIAWVGPRIDRMFSVTAWNCATGYYSFGHEIGHNMGCRHDRGTSNACSSTNSYYGYRDPQARFRSILAYNCVSGQCDGNAGGGCTRRQFFSNPDFLFEGSPMGNNQNNNAGRINDVRETIAGYYASVVTPACTVDTDCNQDVCTGLEKCQSGFCVEDVPAITCSGAACWCDPTLGCVVGSDVALEIRTDNYPGETTWEFRDGNTGRSFDSGGPYANQGTTYTSNVCGPPSGRVDFTIMDAYGDGICCSYGNGAYSIEYDGTVLASGGAFGTSETKSFTISGNNNPPPTTANPTASPTLSPVEAPVTGTPTASPITASPVTLQTPSPTASPVASPPGPTAGDLIISEVVPNPSEISDWDGEYIEIYNPLNVAVDLTGYRIVRERTNRNEDLVGTLGPGQYYLACRNGIFRTTKFGAGSCDITFSFSLRNSFGDVIILEKNDGEAIDSVSWEFANGDRSNKGLARKAGNLAAFSNVDDANLWEWVNVTPKSGPL